MVQCLFHGSGMTQGGPVEEVVRIAIEVPMSSDTSFQRSMYLEHSSENCTEIKLFVQKL